MTSPKRRDPAGKVISGYEVGEVRPDLVAALIVEAFDDRLLDGPVHPPNLAVRPATVRFGEPVLYAVRRPVK